MTLLLEDSCGDVYPVADMPLRGWSLQSGAAVQTGRFGTGGALRLNNATPVKSMRSSVAQGADLTYHLGFRPQGLSAASGFLIAREGATST